MKQIAIRKKINNEIYKNIEVKNIFELLKEEMCYNLGRYIYEFCQDHLKLNIKNHDNYFCYNYSAWLLSNDEINEYHKLKKRRLKMKLQKFIDELYKKVEYDNENIDWNNKNIRDKMDEIVKNEHGVELNWLDLKHLEKNNKQSNIKIYKIRGDVDNAILAFHDILQNDFYIHSIEKIKIENDDSVYMLRYIDTSK